MPPMTSTPIDTETLPWMPLASGISTRPLRFAGDERTQLLKVEPGISVGLHAHAAQGVGEKLTGKTLSINAKAGVDGRLFGSVTNFDIAEALTKQGFEVVKGQVRMPQGPLKTVGEHKVDVALHSDVVVEITVTVVGEAA